MFNVLAVMSLVLCAAMVALWVRSYWTRDYVEHISPSTSVTVKLREGSVVWLKIEMSSPPPYGWEIGSRPISAGESSRDVINTPRLLEWEFMGVRYAHVRPTNGQFTLSTAAVPFWMLLCPTIAIPLLQVMRWAVRQERRAARRAVGQCAECGYDLRATPERCPECGTMPQK